MQFQKLRFSFIPVLLALLLSQDGLTQTFRGAINGSVIDPSGAVVQHAGVVAKDEATGLEHKTETSSEGQFVLQDLPLGSYSVTVAAEKFPTATVTKVPVTAGAIYTLPIKLALAHESTVVEVSADAVALDTTSETQTTTVGGESLQSVPLNGRDFTQLLAATPGFAGYAAGGTNASLNGTRANQLNWQIDGTDNNDLWHNIAAVNQPGVSGIAGVVLPIDAVEEFSVQTESSPEAGRNPGGTVNVVVKSGTNSLHGSAYYYNRNEALAATPPLLSSKPKVRNDQFGGSVGGPIRKDKTFFFVTFERQKFTIGVPGKATVPSTGYQQLALQQLQAHNIPENPVSAALVSALWPASALAAPAGPNNYFSNDPEYGYSNNGVIKLDHRINANHNLAVRWFAGQGNQVAPVGTNIAWYFEGAPIHVQNYSLVLNSTLTPRLTNQLLVGVNYFNQVFYDANNSFNLKDFGLYLSPSISLPGATNLRISGFDQTGRTPPLGRNDITSHLTDAVSFVTGKHQLRFGGEYRRAQLNEFYHRRALGRFQFTGSQGPWNSTDPNVNSLADFLAGYVSSSSIVIGDPERTVYVNSFNLFAQDTFQVTPKLSLSYGVRYDYVGPLHDGYKDLSTFIPNSGLVFQGAGLGNLYPQDWNNVAPRFGFAYRPKSEGNLVVRGGIGVFYDTPNLNPFLDNRPGNLGPNGVEGNPAGESPVSTLLTNANGQTSYTLPTDNSYVFSGTGPTCITGSGCSAQYGIFSVSQKFRSAYVYNYNLNVEKSWGQFVITQIGYVGSQGRKLLTLADINQYNPATGTQPFATKFPNFGVINEVQSSGTSNYNSLQTTLKVNHWRRLSSQFSYTWAHALDEVSQYRGFLPQNSFNLKGDYGNSDFDTRHNFTAVVSYDLPKPESGPAWLLGGWQLSSLLTFRSGLPFNITTDSDTSGTGEGFQRPNLIGDPFAGVSHSIQTDNNGNKFVQWINPAAFAQPAAGTFGNLSRNKFFGPAYQSVDFSIFKNTTIHERVTAQFRVELFNLLNHANFAPPNTNPFTQSVGWAGPSASNGFGQLTDTIGSYNGAPGIGPGEPFNTQLALKIIF